MQGVTNQIICPITLEVPEEPVKTACGHIFERYAIAAWIVNNPSCPSCRAEVHENDLVDLSVRVEEVREEHLPQQPEEPAIQLLNEMIAHAANRHEIEALLVDKPQAAQRLTEHLEKVNASIQRLINGTQV